MLAKHTSLHDTFLTPNGLMRIMHNTCKLMLELHDGNSLSLPSNATLLVQLFRWATCYRSNLPNPGRGVQHYLVSIVPGTVAKSTRRIRCRKQLSWILRQQARCAEGEEAETTQQAKRAGFIFLASAYHIESKQFATVAGAAACPTYDSIYSTTYDFTRTSSPSYRLSPL